MYCTLATPEAYRLSGDRLTRLTTDHVRRRPWQIADAHPVPLASRPSFVWNTLVNPVALHDRFLLCTDGVHGSLVDEAVADIMRVRSAPEDTSPGRWSRRRSIPAAPTTAPRWWLDVVALADGRASEDVGGRHHASAAESRHLRVGENRRQAFVLNALMSEGRYSRLFGAIDEVDGGAVVLKFPKTAGCPRFSTYHAAFVREAWVGTRVTSPWVAHVIELPPGRQSCLYTVMPLYVGELFGNAPLPFPRCRARGGPQHRDPARPRRGSAAPPQRHSPGTSNRTNVIIEAGVVAQVGRSRRGAASGLEDFSAREAIPGTTAYMAPEMFAGEAGQRRHRHLLRSASRSFRAFTGTYPYGNADATGAATLQRPRDPRHLAAGICRPGYRPHSDAPFALDPAERFCRHGRVSRHEIRIWAVACSAAGTVAR